MVVLNIDNTGIFEAYKTQLIIINDCIIRYNINYKGFSFKTLLKSEIINFIVELVKKDIMDWEVIVVISQ